MSTRCAEDRAGGFRARLVRVLGVGLVVAGASLPAHAGLFDDDEARKAILDLRTRLQASEQARESDNAALRRSLLELNNQLDALRAEVAKLRGNEEQLSQSYKELARDVSELQRRQKDLGASVEDRMRRFEPQKVMLEGQEITVDPVEKKAYDDALVILRKGEFGNAVAALTGFQKRFPSSPYSGHVQYWLGNALYGKGDVKGAANVFRGLMSSLPNHSRTPEAMLALANCQLELKDPKAAKKTLEDLVKAHPQNEAAQAARERLVQLK